MKWGGVEWDGDLQPLHVEIVVVLFQSPCWEPAETGEWVGWHEVGWHEVGRVE